MGVFNLLEEDTVDQKMALELFQVVEKIRQAYNAGKHDDADSNFFYDYLALLGTMQNQHFFSQKQTEKMLNWIKDVVDDMTTSGAAASASPGVESKKTKGGQSKGKYVEEPYGKKGKGKGKQE